MLIKSSGNYSSSILTPCFMMAMPSEVCHGTRGLIDSGLDTVSESTQDKDIYTVSIHRGGNCLLNISSYNPRNIWPSVETVLNDGDDVNDDASDSSEIVAPEAKKSEQGAMVNCE